MGNKAEKPVPKTVFVRLTSSEKKEVEILAKKEGQSLSNLFKKALDHYAGYLERLEEEK